MERELESLELVASGSDSDSEPASAGHASAGCGQRRPSRPRPPKLYRIGEVVDYSGLSRQTIHNYTIMGLLHEAKWTRGGHRLYDESVFTRLDLVADMKIRGKSLVDIREYCGRLDKGLKPESTDSAESA